MTQGYGPDHEQQPQWGQGGQNQPPPAPHPQQQWGAPEQAPPAQPQWEQASSQSAPQFGSPAASPSQPQWGQVPPAGAPGGYPGAVGQPEPGVGTGPQFDAGDGVNWRRVKLIGLILLASTAVVLLLRLGINLASFIAADDMAASATGGEIGAVGAGSSLVSLVLYGLNFLMGLIMFVLGIVAAVMGRGRARVGGIVVAAAIPLSVILFWIVTVLMAVILVATGAADDQTGALTSSGYRISAGATALHALLIVAILGLGSFFVHSTATKKLSA